MNRNRELKAKAIFKRKLGLSTLARKSILYMIIMGLGAGFVMYTWLLFASEWSESILRITVVVFVLAIVAILGAVFGSMAFSYPAPKSPE
jgi:hypothetical protein